MITVYGIPNCDACRKARAWLDERHLSYRFHDLRRDGLSDSILDKFEKSIGWKSLLNRRSRTWREISAKQPAEPGRREARRLMKAHVTLIKRPIIDADGVVTVGFSDVVRQDLEMRKTR